MNFFSSYQERWDYKWTNGDVKVMNPYFNGVTRKKATLILNDARVSVNDDRNLIFWVHCIL